MRDVHAPRPHRLVRVLILLAIVLLFVLPAPWDLVGFVVALVLGLGELFFWQRTVRGHRRVVGAETLIGTQAEVVDPCRPNGRVRIGVETWDAACEHGASVGDIVEVVGRRGLRLLVTPVPTRSPTAVTLKE
jgi:membrane protein implicated in regulation of membrane protease activity